MVTLIKCYSVITPVHIPHIRYNHYNLTPNSETFETRLLPPSDSPISIIDIIPRDQLQYYTRDPLPCHNHVFFFLLSKHPKPLILSLLCPVTAAASVVASEDTSPHRTAMSESKSVQSNDVFQELDVDRLEVNVIESLCFSCGKNVSTYDFRHLLFDTSRCIRGFPVADAYLYAPRN